MSKYTLIEYTSEWFDKWNEFVEESNNGTIFHRLDFLDYHEEKFKKNENHLIWLKGETIFAIMPLAIFETQGKRIAQSPYGASFGGIVYKNNLIIKQAIKIIDILFDYFEKKEIHEANVVMPPISYYSNYSNYIEYALSRKGFKIISRDLFNILPLENCIELQSEKYEGRTRTLLRKVKNDFDILENISIDEFYPILLQDKIRLNNSKPTHSLHELQYLKKVFPEDIIIDIVVHKKNKSKAGVCYFNTKNKQTIMTFYIAHEDKAKGLNGTTVLIDLGIKRAIKKGYKFFDFGSSSFGYEVQNIGVAKFKESFGAKGYFRDRFKI